MWADRKLEVRIGINYVPGRSGAVAMVLYTPQTIGTEDDEELYSGSVGYEYGVSSGVFPMRKEVVRITCPAFVMETQCKRVAGMLAKSVGAHLRMLGIPVVLLSPNSEMLHEDLCEGIDEQYMEELRVPANAIALHKN